MKDIDIKLLQDHPEIASSITVQMSMLDVSNLVCEVAKKTALEVKQLFKEQDKSDELLTRQQVAKLLGVTLTTLWNYEKRKVLIPLRIGGRVRYRMSDVQAAMKKND
jgi:predicted DNA-binding transcriptional regulator AlpA